MTGTLPGLASRYRSGQLSRAEFVEAVLAAPTTSTSASLYGERLDLTTSPPSGLTAELARLHHLGQLDAPVYAELTDHLAALTAQRTSYGDQL